MIWRYLLYTDGRSRWEVSEVHLIQSNSLRKSVLLGPESSAVVLVWWHCTKLVSMTGQAAGCCLHTGATTFDHLPQPGDRRSPCMLCSSGHWGGRGILSCALRPEHWVLQSGSSIQCTFSTMQSPNNWCKLSANYKWVQIEEAMCVCSSVFMLCIIFAS